MELITIFGLLRELFTLGMVFLTLKLKAKNPNEGKFLHSNLLFHFEYASRY
jgi:hypothetical protein